MKDKIYTIPVKDAFLKQTEEKCECAVCLMYSKLEQDAVDFVMGSSYMEDDVRAITDDKGFCDKHIKCVYDKNNRLGMALLMSTHVLKTGKDISKLVKRKKTSGFLKKPDNNELIEYIRELDKKCYVCDRIDNFYSRYIDTIFYLYSNDTEFKKIYKESRGLCNRHFADILENANRNLSGKELTDFIETTTSIYLSNMQRVLEDVEWFINKFDYKYQDEPWKEAKDALPRVMTKTNSILNYK